jgi:hypothetical protein
MLTPIIAAAGIIFGALFVTKAREVRRWHILFARMPEGSLSFRVMCSVGHLIYRLMGIFWMVVGVAMLWVWVRQVLKI